VSRVSQCFDGSTVGLYLPRKKTCVLRSASATELTVIAKTIVLRREEDELIISTGRLLDSLRNMLWGKSYQRASSNRPLDDPRAEDYDVLIVLPPNVVTIRHIKISGDYSEAFVD